MDLWTNRWAVVRLDNVRHNYAVIREKLPENCRYMGVVKADAYGHGAREIVPTLRGCGADAFGVATLDEGVEVRGAEPDRPVLALGYTSPRYAQYLAQYRITQNVFSAKYARELSAQAAAAGVKVRVHVKLDTGMNRLGFHPERPETFDEVAAVYRDPNFSVTGIFTHFPVADELSEESLDFTRRQYALFKGFCDRLQAAGIAPGVRHCCNSAAALLHPEMCLDMVRAGIAQYGLAPSGELAGRFDLRPAMELYSICAMVKEIGPGDSVSYGRHFTAEKPMRIATVPIGYADGYQRSLGGKATVLVHGQFAPVIGRVCMDQMMIDVTGIPGVTEGDLVTIVGTDGGHTLSFDDMADLCDTVNYEKICLIGKRIKREYVGA